jgi:hypothetical protein
MAFMDDLERDEFPVAIYHEPKIHTLHEAEKKLPLVKSIVMDILETLSDLKPYEKEYSNLLGIIRPGRDVLIDIDNMGRYIDRRVNHVRSMRDELASLDVELRSARHGTVHWTSRVCGAPVVLCWKPGDKVHGRDHILNWHYIGAPCEHRRSLYPVLQ